MALEVLAIVKHDCPVCDQLLPALDAAGARLVSQSSEEQTARAGPAPVTLAGARGRRRAGGLRAL